MSRILCSILFLSFVLLACSPEKHNMDKKSPESAPASNAAPSQPKDSTTSAAAPKAPEPDYCKVQHCLIAFKGSLPKPGVTRTKDEAKQLAYEILEKARKGENFDALVKKHTDDSHPGIYTMSNFGTPPRKPMPEEFPRNKMVAAFGDTGFPLQVGEYGMADFDPRKSPFGWHIVKRLE